MEMKTQKPMTVGSLFSGIGGIDLGFKQAGFEIAWAIEQDSQCCKTYRCNIPVQTLIENDIRKVNPSELSSIDVLAAGFPCQPFSIAGLQRGFDDDRGNLFYEIIRFIDILKPRVIFLENVSNLLEHDNGNTFKTIHGLLSERKYKINYKIMRASIYGGVPQIRDRIFICAFLYHEDYDAFIFPNPVPLNFNIEDVLKRDIKKEECLYYSEENALFSKIKEIVKSQDRIYRVYHSSIKPTMNHMCPTLTAAMGTRKDQTHIVKDKFGIRKLSVDECLAFQGFPSSFTFPESVLNEDAYKQIGNSVCVPLVARIADRIRIACTTEKVIDNGITLKRGQFLWWYDAYKTAEGNVPIISLDDTSFTVSYNGKYYVRKYDCIGKKLFLESKSKKKCEAKLFAPQTEYKTRIPF